MSNKNSDVNIGMYNASVSHKKVPVVKADILPIFDGIRLYPFRFGVYKKEFAEKDLLLNKVNQAGDDYILQQIGDIDDFAPLIGRQAGTYYPMLGEQYIYLPMPLREGWVYVISYYAEGIYEYKHINYTYKLEKFYKKDKTEIFPTNTTQQYFINLPASDQIYIFYSPVKLEECFLKARFFSKGNLRIRVLFNVKKWLDRNEKDYKSDIENGRLDPLDVKMAFHKSIQEQENTSLSSSHPFRKIVEGAIKNNPPTEKQRDIFLLVDDHLAVGEQLAEDVKASVLGYDAFMKSMRTGKSIEDVLAKMTAKGNVENKIVKDEDLFPGDEAVEQAQSMHSMAVMVKKFFYDTKFTGDLKDYQTKGAKDLKKKQLDAILATELRKQIKNKIDRDRLALNYFIKSRFLSSYVRLFLDRTEYEAPNEADLPFSPDVVEYDFLTEGAAYNQMLDSIKSVIIQFYQALKVSPTVYDEYIENKKDEIESIKKTFDDFVDADKKDELSTFLLDKEVVPQCFFDKSNKKGQEAFQLSFGSPDFFKENAFFVGACISTFIGYIFETRKRDFVFRLFQSHGIFPDFRGTFAHIPIQDIVRVVSEKQFVYKGSGISPSFIARGKGQPQATQIDIKKYGLKMHKIEGTIQIKNIEVQYKAQWHGAENTNIPKYTGIRTLELLKLINDSPFFGPFIATGALTRIMSVLENEEQSTLHKANDITNTLACAAYMSENIIYKVFATNEYKTIRLPRINIRMGVTGINLPATITLKTLFRGATVLANLTEMGDAIIKWRKRTITGDTLGMIAYGTLALMFLLSHGLWYFGQPGWIAYLIVTLVLVIVKVIVDYVVPSDLQLFIKYSVFGKKCKYKMQYAGGNLTERATNLHKDIYTLCMVANKQIDHPKDKLFMKDFRFQLDEFAYVYAFTPSFHQCRLSFYDNRIYKTYDKGVQNQLPSTRIHQEWYMDTHCPWRAAISITGNFVHFADVLESVELDVYLHSRNYCFNLSNLADTRLIANGNVSLYTGAQNAGFVTLKENETLLGHDHKITYQEGILQYYLEANETRAVSEIGNFTQMRTFPLFCGDKYYIYLYVRFKAKDNANWLPYTRSHQNQYIIYRYKAERMEKNNNFSFNLSFDKVSIGVKSHK